MLTDEFLRHGLAAPPTALIEVAGGAPSAPLRSRHGFVALVPTRREEILRGIYFALRDRNWGTVPGQLIERQREVGTDTFRIKFECEHRQAGIHFTWRATDRRNLGRDGAVRLRRGGALRVPEEPHWILRAASDP